MPDCVSCTTLPACSCGDDEICVLVGRSCDSCGENTCQADPNKASSGGGGPSVGATAGGAVGGALGALIMALAFYWFWRRRKRQAMSRKLGSYNNRASYRDNVNSTSSKGGPKVRFGEDAKAESSPAPRRDNRMSRSMAMNLEEKGLDFSDEPNAPPHQVTAAAVSSPSSQQDDPFGDQHSSALIDAEQPTTQGNVSRSASHRSQRAGLRTSQASAPMPAAYIPAHANSMSVADGLERDSLGAHRQRSSQADPKSSLPELRLSLGPLPQTEEQVMAGSAHGSSPALSTPGTGTPAGSTAANSKHAAKPARPTREGLDLRLPNPSASSSVKTASFGVSSPPISPGGFPWSSAGPSPHASGIDAPPPTTAANSRFSTTTSRDSFLTDDRNSLAPPSMNRGSTANSGHMSVASHMSYILNPPQIVTATSTGRVGVVGPAVARTVHLGSSAPNAPAAIESLDSASAIPTVPHQPQSSPLKRDTLSSLASDDPFADEVSAVIGQFPQPLGSPSMHSSTAPNTPIVPSNKPSSTLRPSSVDGDEPPAHRTSRAPTPTSMVFSSGPSPRNSMVSDGAFNSRPNTMFSANERPVSKDSLLDSMPFQPPLQLSSLARGSFPSPAPSVERRQTQATLGSLVMDDVNAPLPEPTRPYAMGSSTTERHSNASSLGALENIPFNLGFSGNDRTSVWSEVSDGTGLRDSHFSASNDAPPVPSMDLSRHSSSALPNEPVSVASQSEARDSSYLQQPQNLIYTSAEDKEDAERLKTPGSNVSFEQQQQQQSPAKQQPQEPAVSTAPEPAKAAVAPSSQADSRASVDSFMASALLAQQFEDSA